MTKDFQGEGNQLGNMTENPWKHILSLSLWARMCVGHKSAPDPCSQHCVKPPPSPHLTPALACLSPGVFWWNFSPFLPLKASRSALKPLPVLSKSLYLQQTLFNPKCIDSSVHSVGL